MGGTCKIEERTGSNGFEFLNLIREYQRQVETDAEKRMLIKPPRLCKYKASQKSSVLLSSDEGRKNVIRYFN